jgi:hypothetical protein
MALVILIKKYLLIGNSYIWADEVSNIHLNLSTLFDSNLKTVLETFERTIQSLLGFNVCNRTSTIGENVLI